MRETVTAIALVIVIPVSLVTGASAAEPGPVKVFILAGQSNMEGKAPNTLLDYQAEDPTTKDLFKHLRQDGKSIIVHDEVFIEYLDRKGPLTIGCGSSYRNMMAEVKETFNNYETMFPALKGKKLELAGFVWFQGWTDMYGGAENEYASNMKHFIKDLRKDLNSPNLPFVIAAMGQNGSKPAGGAMLTVREAQMSMNDVQEK